jgi:hypothetical protein
MIVDPVVGADDGVRIAATPFHISLAIALIGLEASLQIRASQSFRQSTSLISNSIQSSTRKIRSPDMMIGSVGHRLPTPEKAEETFAGAVCEEAEVVLAKVPRLGLGIVLRDRPKPASSPDVTP